MCEYYVEFGVLVCVDFGEYVWLCWCVCVDGDGGCE